MPLAITILQAVAAAATPVAPAPNTATPQKKVCRASVATGSILAGRLCMTREKWRDADRRDQSNVDAVRHSLNSKGGDRSY